MTQHSIDGIFEAIRELKVLVIGDVMVDAYIYGSVKRISPEAPVPVVSVENQENRLGGAANVALNLQSLGATPIMCSVIGDDMEAETFFNLLDEQGLDKQGIIRSSERITTLKQRVMSGSQHLIRIDREEENPLNSIDKKSLIGHIQNLLPKVDLVILEDYDKGCLDEELIHQVIVMANDLKIPVAVDPKRKKFSIYNGCTLFKPNLSELALGVGIKVIPSETSLLDAIEKLRKTAELKNILVTLAKDGVFFYNDQSHGLYDSHKRQIADISGAGDTVICIAAIGIALGLPLPFIAEFANLGGGIVCEYQGVVPVDVERLKSEAKSNQLLHML